ncbi:hypothetical protein DRW07_05465 [Alteromonas sediminis]|uniref:Membrane protein YkvI n=1 Tax=Alteromonas sediminis TaxID=2259342 RepID=A0A3N5Y226_9ALTE|nr:hypothetical protein [Alteromonas sediminis]RPJ66993.1 hypothetical protein DRW07_05465 [Alteromonas sediminis]
MKDFFRIYLVPGFVFQSVVIGGGYATGRELIEFFFAAGPIGGILGLIVAGTIFGLVLAVAFEFARVHNAHDYRLFCKALLGRYWVLYEVAFLVLLVLILSVLASASGELLNQYAGLPIVYGTVLMMTIVGGLTYCGSDTIQRFLMFWSLLLYGVYIAMFVLTFWIKGEHVAHVYQASTVGHGWVAAGVLYSGYNLAIIPVVLFAVKQHISAKQSVGAGMFAGALSVIPAILFFVSMMAMYPQVGNFSFPSAALMNALELPLLSMIFHIVIFGTFIETGTALLHSVNDRIESSMLDLNRTFPTYLRPLVSIACLGGAIILGNSMGLIALIAQGYSLLTMVFMVVLVLPLITVGIWRIRRFTPSVPN